MKKNAPLFIDHIVLVVKNIKRARTFYDKIFGKPDFAGKTSLMYWAGAARFFVVLPYDKLPPSDRFSPNRIGLEHLAFGVRTLKELKAMEQKLSASKIVHSGIHMDIHSKKEKIWLDDPDGIRLEFYLRK